MSPYDAEVIKAYIDNQAIHHAKKGFKEELLELLNEHGLEYDERYLWT